MENFIIRLQLEGGSNQSTVGDLKQLPQIPQSLDLCLSTHLLKDRVCARVGTQGRQEFRKFIGITDEEEKIFADNGGAIPLKLNQETTESLDVDLLKKKITSFFKETIKSTKSTEKIHVSLTQVPASSGTFKTGLQTGFFIVKS